MSLVKELNFYPTLSKNNSCVLVYLYLYIYINIHNLRIRVRIYILRSIINIYRKHNVHLHDNATRTYTGVIKHTKQTHRRIVKSARQRPEENSINPLMASIRLANRERKKGRKKTNEQTNKQIVENRNGRAVRNRFRKTIIDRISITRPRRRGEGRRGNANERFARIRSVTVLQMYTSLLYFCCMCHLACYSWLNFRVPALIDTRRGGEPPSVFFCPLNRCAHLLH